MRKKESNKTLKTTNNTELAESERLLIQNKLADKVLEDPGGQSDSDRSHSDFDPAESENRCSFHSSRSETDVETDVEQSKVHQPAEDKNFPPIGHRNDQSKSTHEEVVGKTDSAGFKTEEERNRLWEEEEAPFKERRATWKHGQQASSNSSKITQQDLLVRNGHSNKPLIATSTSEETGKPHPDPYNDSEGIRRNSLCSQQEDDNGFLTESGRFIRNVKSPRLRRKNPNNLQPSIPSDTAKKAANGLELCPDTNYNGNQRRASNPCIKPQDSHRVLKLGSLKNNPETLWNVPEKRSSPDPETLSEPEQTPDGNRQTKLKLKTQRSASIPEISSRRRSLSPPPGTDSQFHPSPLQDLLQRAKEREKGRGLGKRVGKTFPQQNSPISASSSPSASEGENSAGPSMISGHGWIEGNVDGSEDEMKDR